MPILLNVRSYIYTVVLYEIPLKCPLYSHWSSYDSMTKMLYMLIFSLSLAVVSERKGALCLCERGKRQPVCLSGRVSAGVYRDTLTAMETSGGPDCLGHTPHHWLYLHLLRPLHLALGPGNLTPLAGFRIKLYLYQVFSFWQIISDT